MRKAKSKRAHRGRRQARRRNGFQAGWHDRKSLLLEPLETRILLSVNPQLIDLNPLGTSAPDDFLQIGDVAFFVAEDGTHGRELWKTDGTPAGTTLVKDIRPGSGSSAPSGLTDFNGTLFFAADDGQNGQELWKSNGTAAGTVMVRDINPGEGYQYPYGDGPLQSFPRDMTVVDGRLFFSAENSAGGAELWMTDGTSAGTVMVRDIFPGTYTDSYGTYPNASNPLGLVDVDGTLFFSADDGENGRELWKSDGTAAGTVMVKDIFPGTDSSPYGEYPNASNPGKLTAVDGTLLFLAQDEAHGAELWKSDGTAAGTVMVKDIRSGTDHAFTSNSPVIAVDGTLFFAANDGVHGDELWKSDGTSAGTVLVKDIQPGSEGILSQYAGFTDVDGTLFFSATDGSAGRELWKSDGTAAGTVLIKDINPGTDTSGAANNSYPYYMDSVNGTLYFSAYSTNSGRELWRSDGTTGGTVLVADAVPGAIGLYPSSLESVNGILLFSGDGGSGLEFWTLDTLAEDTFSARLTVFVDTQQVTIPANVGVYSDDTTASLFTTDNSGELFIDPDNPAALGAFFDVWRTDAGLAGNNPNAVFSDHQLLDNVADVTSTVRMFVNGDVSTEFDGYVPQDGDRIVLVYGANPVVSLKTNFGPLVIELFEGQTPGTVDNFLNYVSDGDYINSFFHRSETNFVIQGGGFTTTSTTFTSTAQFSGVPTDPPILNEPGISNVRGTVAMAKVGGDPNSATSQFFVNLSDTNTFLDLPENDSFTVFAQVLDMRTVDIIAALPIDFSNPSPYGQLPLTTGDQLAVIQSIEGQGTLTGVKFADVNENGLRDAGEPGLAGLSVFLDANNNGVLDAGEASTATDADGRFLLQVEPGTYTVRAEVSATSSPTVPVSPDSYTVVVEIGRETAGLTFGETTLGPPGGVDLLAATDSGVADDDDLTNLNNATPAAVLQFQVSGVADGAEVRIYSDGIQIGSGTAAGGTAIITTDGSTSLSDGARNITATQVLDADQSDPSAALAVTIDTTPPGAITNTAPDVAQVGQLYAFDADSPDEGQAGVTYSLVGQPAAMTIVPQTGVIDWTPGQDQAGPHSFEIHITDAAGNVTSQTVDLTVLGVIPTWPDAYSTDEDSPLVVDAAAGVLANDGDENSGVLSAAVVDLPAHGSLTLGADGSFTYTPDGDFFGTDGFTYIASDQDEDSAVTQVTIDVVGVNDPTVALDDAYTLAEDAVLTVGAVQGVLANDSDPDTETLTATLAGQAGYGVVVLSADGSFSYTPAAEFHGTDSFTYIAHDGADDSDPVTVTLTVTEVLDPPTAVADSYSVEEDGTLTVDASLGVLANDSDPDSDTITATPNTLPANGTLTLDGDGSFVYTPDGDFFGTDGFTYTASDGDGNTSVAGVTITVTGVNDPPVPLSDAYTLAEDTTLAIDQDQGVLANDTDADGDVLTATLAGPATHGMVTLDADGSFGYTPDAHFSGTDSFTYTLSDGVVTSDPVTVTLTVTEV
ncbi:MAG TPA: ELWxxDGT repeat protein, partial [Thermoguttaceae bacterium]|nr:ELWxxDGT repeat protein [Thermoguttaceae bacterium]